LNPPNRSVELWRETALAGCAAATTYPFRGVSCEYLQDESRVVTC
jgi:hypothetical protein